MYSRIERGRLSRASCDRGVEVLLRDLHRRGKLDGIERVGPRKAEIRGVVGRFDAFLGTALVGDPLHDEREPVDDVRRVGLAGRRALEHPPRLLVCAHFEEHVPLEGAVARLVTDRLDGPPDQEDSSLEVVEVEERLRLEVTELGLQRPIQARQLGASRQQFVAALESQFELAHLLDEQFDAVQVGSAELAVRRDRPLEFVQGLVDPTFVPKDLAASVVGFGAGRVGLQGLVEPGKGLVDPTAMRRFHRLIEAVPVAILIVLHGSGAPDGRAA